MKLFWLVSGIASVSAQQLSRILNSTFIVPPISNSGPGGFFGNIYNPSVYIESNGYRPGGAVDATYAGNYSPILDGHSNIYAVYYGASSSFDNAPNQSGPTAPWGLNFTVAMDDFLANYNATGLWKLVTQYYGIDRRSNNYRYPTTLTFQKSIRIDGKSRYYLGAESFNGKDKVEGLFKSVFEGGDLPFDDNGIYMMVMSEQESYRHNPSLPWFIGRLSTNNACAFHDASILQTSLGTKHMFYGIVSVPKDRNQGCFRRMEESLARAVDNYDNTASRITRFAVLNAMSHELMEIVTNPIPFTSWTLVESTTTYEPADRCEDVYMHTWIMNDQQDRFQVNTQVGKYWYTLHSMWSLADQHCRTSPYFQVNRFRLVSLLRDNFCVHQAAPTIEGTQFQLRDCDMGEHQEFYTTSNMLKLAMNDLCMDVRSANTAAGTAVQQGSCNNDPAQQWRYNATDFTLRPGLNVPRCLEVSQASTSNGANLQIVECNGSMAQKFHLLPAGTFTLRTELRNNLCIDSPISSNLLGVQVGLADCYNGINQQLRYTWRKEIHLANSLCLEVKGGGKTHGVPVQQWPCNGQAHQQWHYNPTTKRLHPLHNLPGCLGIQNGKLILSDCNTSASQRFSFV